MLKLGLSPNAKPPSGFDEIEPVLMEFAKRMDDAEKAPHFGQNKQEPLHLIKRISAERSRWIFEQYSKDKQISKEIYDFLLKQKLADADLIAKWKKQGYEKLCCVQCIYPQKTSFGNSCVCRVPRAHASSDVPFRCTSCGCQGCASSD